MNRNLKSSVALSILALALSACEGYSEGNLVGDAMNDKLCPPGCIEAQTAPSSETLFIKLDNLASLRANSGGKLEVSGLCRTLFSNSSITFKAIMPGAASINLTAIDVLSKSSTVSGTVSCYDGRFQAMLSLGNVPAGSYTLTAEITSLSDQLQLVQNTINGVSKLPLQVIN
ncbi:MAG: hypothetical protein ACLGGX_07540 [Bdellovibrionia bacterium]